MPKPNLEKRTITRADVEEVTLVSFVDSSSLTDLQSSGEMTRIGGLRSKCTLQIGEEAVLTAHSAVGCIGFDGRHQNHDAQH